MNGGIDQSPPEPAHDHGRCVARRASRAEDADALAGAPFVAEALARLPAAITDLLDARWGALGPEQLAASARALYREQARLAAAALRSVKAIDGRDDIVTRARPGTAAATFLRHSLCSARGTTARSMRAGRGRSS